MKTEAKGVGKWLLDFQIEVIYTPLSDLWGDVSQTAQLPGNSYLEPWTCLFSKRCLADRYTGMR